MNMRELTLPQTGYLAGLLLLSLVLPTLMSFGGPLDAAARRSCMKTVWLGQALGVFAGLAVLASASVALGATVCGAVSCACCALVFLRQTRAVPAPRRSATKS
jgi:hypothetical protein